MSVQNRVAPPRHFCTARTMMRAVVNPRSAARVRWPSRRTFRRPAFPAYSELSCCSSSLSICSARAAILGCVGELISTKLWRVVV